MSGRVLTALLSALAVLALAAGGARAGGNIQIRNPENAAQIISTHWDPRRLPIHWVLSKDGLPGSGISNATLEAELQAAFNSWDALPTANVAFVYDGQVDARDGRNGGAFAAGVDGRNLVTFTDPDFLFPEGQLAVTLTTFFTDSTVVTPANADLDGDGVADLPVGTYPPGSVFDADIVFNSSIAWAVSGGADTFDLQSVALHEVGHLLGLCHSGIRHAVMWPFLPPDVQVRSPDADDVAWISNLYPAEPALSAAFGKIAGKITDGANGLPILGAHVYTVDPATQGTVVGSFSNDDGTYVIPGLAPGPYLVAIEPLDGDPPGLEPFRVNEVVASTLETAFPEEFRDAAEGAVEGDPTAFEVIPVTAGNTVTGRDVVTNTLTLPGASARLGAGFNLFSWPLGVPVGTTAFELLHALGGPEAVVSVDRYLPRTGAFERAEHVDGVAVGADFPLGGGEGYVVHMVRDRIAGFTGGPDCPLLDLAPGLNLIGVPCRPPGYTAFALLQDLGSAVEVDRVVRWDPDAKTYATARYGAGGAPEGDDFPIARGEGYMALMRTAKGGVRLPRPGRDVTPQIAGLSPGRGVPGTVVAILGEGFDPDPVKNLVTFNGVPAAVIVASTTTLTASVPGAATSGPVQVKVGARASNTLDFVVEPASVQVPPGGTAELVSGQTVQATLDADGEQDRYTFTALAGSVVTISAESVAAGVPDLLLVLEDPFGTMAATDDNSGGGTNPRINNFALNATGTHTIVVTNVPGSGTGAYRLTLAIATRPAETQISILGGDNQTAEMGTALDDPLTIFATGPTGAPLSGIPVTYVATEVEITGEAAGPINASSVFVATNASGIVSIQSILPNRSGVFEIEVDAPPAKPVKFRVAAVSTRIASVTMVSNGQHGQVNTPLMDTIRIELAGPSGAPVAGALVVFKVIAGGGRILQEQDTTGATGVVDAEWVLGKDAGSPQLVAAFVPGRSKPLIFEAIAEAGPPRKIESNRSSFNRLTLGARILNALFVRVLDEFGNPVEGQVIDYTVPDGITVAPGLGQDGVMFTDFKTNAAGLHVAALEVPLVFHPQFPSDLTSAAAPSIDEFGVQRLPPYTVTARVRGTSLQQTFQAHVDMGPRLVNDPFDPEAGNLEVRMGTAAPSPVRMQLYRIERVQRGVNGDFRDDDFTRLLVTSRLPGAVVHVTVTRRDGQDETSVGLRPTRTDFTDDVTDGVGTVEFPLTAGDVGGFVDVTGRIRTVTVLFVNAKNVSATFENPSALSSSTIVGVLAPQLGVELTDSGSGVDLETVVATLNGTDFFDGHIPLEELPRFPDDLEVLIAGREVGLLNLRLLQTGAFDRVTMYYTPSLRRLVATKNKLEVGPSTDRAGNPDPSTASTEFDWP